jgi:hypothetical protein
MIMVIVGAVPNYTPNNTTSIRDTRPCILRNDTRRIASVRAALRRAARDTSAEWAGSGEHRQARGVRRLGAEGLDVGGDVPEGVVRAVKARVKAAGGARAAA